MYQIQSHFPFLIPLLICQSLDLINISTVEHDKGVDKYSSNPVYFGKKYRQAYAYGVERPCNFPNTLPKVKSHTNAAHKIHPSFLIENRARSPRDSTSIQVFWLKSLKSILNTCNSTNRMVGIIYIIFQLTNKRHD